jgi:hypothetical protein
MVKLFDEKSGFLTLDEAVQKSPEFQKIMADGQVTDEEIKGQVKLVIDLFKEIDSKLSDKDKELVVKAIAELAVLYEVSAYKDRGGRYGNF